MTIEQFKFIEKILNTKKIELTKEYMREINFGYNFVSYSQMENDEISNENNIIGFRIE